MIRGDAKKEIFSAFGIDVVAVAGWLGSYGGEDSPCDISRGLFASEVGVPRRVEPFRRFGIRTTWFIPGHSVETFPDQCRMRDTEGLHEGLPIPAFPAVSAAPARTIAPPAHRAAPGSG